jgi:calcineurin-like phosphoesterase family protein
MTSPSRKLRFSDEEVLRLYALVGRSTTLLAQKLDLSERNTRHHLRRLGVQPGQPGGVKHEMPEALRTDRPIAPRPAFDIPELPEESLPIEELLRHRKAVARQTIIAHRARELIRVPVRRQGPFVLAWIGDPHVDDNGCDIEQLDHDLSLIGRTPGMFACHVGDVTNNWGRRLAHLWAHQSTSGEDAKKLVRWMFELAPPLILVEGNHDSMGGPMDGLLSSSMRVRAIHQDSGARLALMFGNGQEMRVHVRHDFPGRSMYSKTHGMARELREGYRDHFMIAGHLHTDEVRVTPVETDNVVSWAVRVSGYKVVDHYAHERRFVSARMAPTFWAAVNPEARCPAELIKPFWDGAEAADWLDWKSRVLVPVARPSTRA